MNLTRVLNNALPDIPARVLSERPPRKPTDLVFREHQVDGEAIVRVVIPNVDAMFNFTPANWNLIQFFNGEHTYEEIAALYSSQTGHAYSLGEVREFADALEEAKFWYKTTQEKNVQLMQLSADERRKLVKNRKSAIVDLAEIKFPAINPDKFVDWLYGHSQFVYTWWFSLATLVSFTVAAAITVTHWDEIGSDTLQFFTFTDKSWYDVFVFYVLALLSMCWHELAHAHACKHYGGRVQSMGFLLIYLTPAFYTDTSEGFVLGGRPQRFIIAMAGAWSELYLCAVATPVWWATPPGSSIHNAAYLIMLMTGIFGLFLNWNPLMKLDGYYMLSEALGIADLKENSTAYVSAWLKRNIWRLPVEVPYVPKSRRLGFAVYALLSGAYSYTVLYILARFVGNVFRNFNPEWSFVPELATAGLIFRSRIRTLVNFMKFVYLDKKDRLREWSKTRTAKGLFVAAMALMLLPIWRESVDARFILQSANSSVVRNRVPGTVTAVFAKEGAILEQGAPLLRLESVELESRLAESEAEYSIANVRTRAASLHYTDLGAALKDRERLAKSRQGLAAEEASLKISSPIDGTVLTPRLGEWLGSYVPAGTELLEVADLRQMRARVYVSDYDMYKLRVGAPARLSVEGFPKLWSAQTVSITPLSSMIDPQIVEADKYKGLNPLNFYSAELLIANPEEKLKPGMAGTARIYGERRSLVSHMGREILRFFGRKLW